MARSLVIYVGSNDRITERTLIEFTNDLGNQAAGFASNSDLSTKLARTDPAANVIITNLRYISQDDGKGIAFLQQMHQQHPDVAVILISNITNGGTDLSASEAASCGVHYFLHEPIRLSELELYLTRL